MRQNYVNGVVTGTSVTAALFLFPMIFGPSDTMVSRPETQFKVVNKYRGCDIIRFNPMIEPGYHYFLDCRYSN